VRKKLSKNNIRRNFREHAPVSSAIDFLKAIDEVRLFAGRDVCRGSDQAIWFRGQNNIDWPLTPKFYRPEFSTADEPETRELFQSRAIQLLRGREPKDEWEWYFLMQHHGAPTRLLDWTGNPLIALYFAVRNHSGQADAVVWILAPYWLNEQNSFLKRRGVWGPILPSWSEARDYLIDLEVAFGGSGIRRKLPAAIEAPHVDARLHAQASRFVVFGKDRDLARMFDIQPKYFGLARIPISFQSTKSGGYRSRKREKVHFTGVPFSLLK
jgi:hypothetical protein